MKNALTRVSMNINEHKLFHAFAAPESNKKSLSTSPSSSNHVFLYVYIVYAKVQVYEFIRSPFSYILRLPQHCIEKEICSFSSFSNEEIVILLCQ